MLAAGQACGSDDPGSGPGAGPGTEPPPAPTAAVALVTTLEPADVTLEGLLRHFDVDDDGDVDAADRAALEACLAAGADLDGRACDIVPDGVVDAQDRYALDLALGSVKSRTQAQRAATAAALRENAAGGFAPALVQVTFDWNADGVTDAADLARLADALEDDMTPLDLDGDGMLAFADVWRAARAQAAVAGGGAAPAVDLDEDGDSDSDDLTLLAELAFFATETMPGVFDANVDARIDSSDFCIGSNAAADPNLLTHLVPESLASSMWSGAQPSYLVCRADGRSMFRRWTRVDTPLTVTLEVSGLYLQPVSSVPAEYTPIDPGAATGRELFVVGTTPTDHALVSFTLPWGPRLEAAPSPTVVLEGPALPATASLVLPTSVVPLAVVQSLGLTRADRGAAPVPLVDQARSQADTAAASDLAQKLEEARSSYESLIAGCPCTLDAPTRDALVRWLLATTSAFEGIQGVNDARLSALEIDLERVTRLNVSASNEARARWEFLAETTREMALAGVLLLVAETGYDFATGGPGKALSGAISNGLGELATDFELLPPAGSFCGDTAVNVGSSMVSGGALDLVGLGNQITMTLATQHGGTLTTFTRQFAAEAMKELSLKSFTQAQIEGIVKSLIKTIPVWFVHSAKLAAEDAERRAVALAAQFDELSREVGNRRAASQRAAAALIELKDLRQRFLAKLGEDGCGVTVSTSDPCSFALEAKITDARGRFDTAFASAESAASGARDAAGREGGADPCSAGDARRAVDSARVAERGALFRMAEHARSGASAAALDELTTEITDATAESQAANADFALFCDVFTGGDITQEAADSLYAAEDASQAAREAYEAELRAALDEYAACVGGSTGACGFDAALAEASPWEALARSAGCLPTFVQNCCGDGRLQAGEQCDPGVAALACAGGVACVACQCGGGGVHPPAVGDLAALVGATVTGWQPLTLTTTVHSAVSVPSKPVAGDDTTLNGMFPTLLDLSQSILDSLEAQAPCGSNSFGVTVCGPGTPPLGQTLVIFTSYAAPISLVSPGQIYQRGFVFEPDTNGSNNYTPSAQYANDFFAGTQFWFDVSRSGSGGFSLSATDATDNVITPVPGTAARAVLHGDAAMLLVPIGEVGGAPPEGLRVTAFRHTGDYGIPAPHDWDGSLFPAVADGLAPFP